MRATMTDDHFDADMRFDGVDALMDIRFGCGRISELGDYLRARGLHRAMIVCGGSTARTAALIDPITAALGERLVGVFAGASSKKTAEATFDGVAELERLRPDVLIGVGGGASLVAARQIQTLAADGRSLDDLRAQARADGKLPRVEEPAGSLPAVMVPTTMTGADISRNSSSYVLAADASPTGRPVLVNSRSTPRAAFIDPTLFEATPGEVLIASAMNGLNKGFETIYSTPNTHVSDAFAVHGTRLMVEGFRAFHRDRSEGLRHAVAGLTLVQMRKRTSIIHAFGHAISQTSDVYQGDVHSVLAPHILAFLLGQGDVRRRELVRSLDVEVAGHSDDELAAGIIAAVTEVRDALGTPRRWSETPGADTMVPSVVAEAMKTEHAMADAPLTRPMSTEQVIAVLAAGA